MKTAGKKSKEPVSTKQGRAERVVFYAQLEGEGDKKTNRLARGSGTKIRLALDRQKKEMRNWNG